MYKRRNKLVCYKCGRVGHLQFTCYSYCQPEHHFRTPEHRQDFHQRECKRPSPRSSAYSNALDDQQGPFLQNYHNPHTSSSQASLGQPSDQPGHPSKPTSDRDKNLSGHKIAVSPKGDKTTHQGQASSKEEQKQEHVPLSYKSDFDLNRSDLTIAGEVVGQPVQLLIDTGACISAMDVKFLKTVYGQRPPKMTDGSLSTVRTINGDKVPVLGKITVLLHFNGREYPCDFHVMQNLAFDAILGRNFLQENGALIDLERSSVTFKGTGYLGKQTNLLRDEVM